jgi:hypothetical protein
MLAASGDYRETFERCLAEFGWEEKRALQGREIVGRYHGVAVACFIEGGGHVPDLGGRERQLVGIAPNEAKALATALAISPPIGMIAPSPAPLWIVWPKPSNSIAGFIVDMARLLDRVSVLGACACGLSPALDRHA